MKKNILSVLLFLVLSLIVAVPASASPIVGIIPPPAKPSQALPVVEQLGQQLQNLVDQAATKNNSDDDINSEPEPTFGTRALTFMIAAAGIIEKHAQLFVSNFAAWPQFTAWLGQQASDPRLLLRWQQIGSDAARSVLPAILLALACDFLFYPLRRKLRSHVPTTTSGAIATLVALFLIRAIPICLFIGVALAQLDQIEAQRFQRFVIMNVVYALSLSRIVFALLRGMFAPRSQALRLLPMSDEQAFYAYGWLNAFGVPIIVGYFCLTIAHAMHVPQEVVTAFLNILGLILVAMAIVVIAQKRGFIADLLRGQARHDDDMAWLRPLRGWFAATWHVLATAYLVIGYLIAALGVEDGFALMLRGTLCTLAALVVMRILFDRTRNIGGEEPGLYQHTLRFVIGLVIWAFGLLTIAAAWGTDLQVFFTTPVGQRILGSTLSVGITVIVLVLLYGAFSRAVDRYVNRRDAEAGTLQTSARVRTLLPMLRHTVLILCIIIVALIILSEAGVNIAPLLAGAGVLGVAVGFGSQTLVKDFLTGLFIVIENTIAIGDVVKIADHSGTIEAISMRTVRLRDSDGALHVLPFSEVSKIVNMTKDFGYALITLGIACDADVDLALRLMNEVAEEMRADPAFARSITSPMDVWGVTELGDFSVKITGRLRTLPGEHWAVKREYLYRIKKRFDAAGVVMPYPTSVMVSKPN
ncbi:MAG: mechanosensitive ion channel [Alphaproteobacteria bacterium]|nr:mechanosensitive ion channel [Alphaproteobacteria bacterium]MBV8549449.1 mechanosensitive ion channel [Alphaproteobacteria bacterium]